MEDLLERIQASEQEIKSQLEVIHACQIDGIVLFFLSDPFFFYKIPVDVLVGCLFFPPGYWRVLDFDYEIKLLGHVTQLVDSESWSFNKVPLQTSLDELAPLEPRYVNV